MALVNSRCLRLLSLQPMLVANCSMRIRLRINLIGNALGVGLEFVDYAIQQSRKKNNYEIRRLRHLEPEV